MADLPRKPRGGPANLAADYDRRQSFCCAVEGCRKRRTPPSVRFLGRTVTWAPSSCWRRRSAMGRPGRGAARLRELLGVDAQTLARWRQWWRATFAASPWWTVMRGRFVPPVATAALPGALLERFAGERSAPLVALLRFVAPMTTTSDAAGLFEGRREPAEDAR